jgi:hypothetical protein
VLLFDRLAAVLVTAWFVAGLWLVMHAVRGPRPAASARDGERDRAGFFR